MTKADKAMQAGGQERKCAVGCTCHPHVICSAFSPMKGHPDLCGNPVGDETCFHFEACHAPAAPLPATVTISLEHAKALSDACESLLEWELDEVCVVIERFRAAIREASK